jgi:deoxyribonuclease IV
MHDFEIAHRTGFDAVNVHIGKQKGYATRDEAFAQMKSNVEIILKHNTNQGYTPQFLFEITAGQGSELGTTIEEIGYFYQNYLRELPVKFCFDTAHARGAGNDLAHRDQLLSQWDTHIGLDNLYCFHLNDAKVARGSHLDRHAPLGK